MIRVERWRAGGDLRAVAERTTLVCLWGATAALAAYALFAYTVISSPGIDTHAYWLAGHLPDPYGSRPGEPDAVLYSPLVRPGDARPGAAPLAGVLRRVGGRGDLRLRVAAAPAAPALARPGPAGLRPGGRHRQRLRDARRDAGAGDRPLAVVRGGRVHQGDPGRRRRDLVRRPRRVAARSPRWSSPSRSWPGCRSPRRPDLWVVLGAVPDQPHRRRRRPARADPARPAARRGRRPHRPAVAARRRLVADDADGLRPQRAEPGGPGADGPAAPRSAGRRCRGVTAAARRARGG